MNLPPMANTKDRCPHTRTRLIAKDKDAEYQECLDCGEILERTELEDPTSFEEDLSDA